MLSSRQIIHKRLYDNELRLRDRPGQLRMVGQFSASPSSESLPIFSTNFARRSPGIFGCSDEEGNVSIIRAFDGEILGHVRHPDSIFDVQFSHDDSLLLLASADEFTYIRPTERLSGNPLMCLGYHQGTVRSARWREGDPNVLVTASRDGDVALWDLRILSSTGHANDPVNTYCNVHKKLPSQSGGRRSGVTGERSNVIQAEFLPLQDHLIATIGQPDHAIKFWDIRYKWGSNSAPIPVDQINTPLGNGTRERAFTSFTCSSSDCGSTIYAANANNQIYQYSLSNYSSTPIRTFSAPGYESGSFFIKLALSPDGSYLASGSLQDSTFIWSTDGRTSYKVGGHYKEVTAVSWSLDGRGDLNLLSCGEDGTINLWSENKEDATEMLGFGRPTSLSAFNDDLEKYSDEPTVCSYPDYISELENFTLRSSLHNNLENIRPSTPPNLLIPVQGGSGFPTGKKSAVISDYFRPALPGISVTEQLLASHRTSPCVPPPPAQDETNGLKRLSSMLNFCSSPLRPTSKLARPEASVSSNNNTCNKLNR